MTIRDSQAPESSSVTPSVTPSVPLSDATPDPTPGVLADPASGATPDTPPGPPPEQTPASRLAELKRNWDGLAAHDAMWAILSDPAKINQGWQADEFFASGRQEIAALREYIVALLTLSGASLEPRRAMDFGCGLGRLSQALAAHFQRVDGVDISEVMVAQALTHDQSGGKVHYHVNTTDTLPFDDGSFDLVYSNIVLQHIDKANALRYMAEFVRVLAPGGLVIFSMPSRHLESPDATLVSPVEAAEGTLVINMHPIPRAEVEACLVAAGARIVHVHDYPVAGPGYECFRYAATR